MKKILIPLVITLLLALVVCVYLKKENNRVTNSTAASSTVVEIENVVASSTATNNIMGEVTVPTEIITSVNASTTFIESAIKNDPYTLRAEVYSTAGGLADQMIFDGVNMWTVEDYAVSKISLNGNLIISYQPDKDTRPRDIAFDGKDAWTVNWAGESTSSVSKFSANRKVTTYFYKETNLGPRAIAFDGVNMWTANAGTGYGQSNSVTKITPDGEMKTYKGTGLGPVAIAFDGVNMWTANGADNSVTKITPKGVMTTYRGTGINPVSIAFDGVNMWTADEGGNIQKDNEGILSFDFVGSVTKISPTGKMTTFTNGPDFSPRHIIYDGKNMWALDDSRGIAKILPDGTILKHKEIEPLPLGAAFDGKDIWAISSWGNIKKIYISRLQDKPTNTTVKEKTKQGDDSVKVGATITQYKNNYLGFSMQYPSKYIIKIDNQELSDEAWKWSSFVSLFERGTTTVANLQILPLSINLNRQPTVENGSTYHSLKELLETSKEKPEIFTNKNKVEIAKFKPYEGQEGIGDTITYTLINKDIIYNITTRSNNPEIRDIIDSIKFNEK